MLAIEARGLCKAYRGRNVVDGLDMHVTRGDIYGFVGRNGAGKSTTMKMICGMIRPTAGEVLLFDRPSIDASGEAPESSTSTGAVRIGALVENPGLYPNMTALENMRCKAMALGLVDSVAEIEQLLCIVGLDAAGKKPTKRYSLGMKQRLGLAMALMGEPEVLVLDEPTSGLDPSGIVEMRDLLQRLNRERGVTVVLSSHHLAELEQVATEYAFLRRGRLMEQVSAEVLRARCADCIDIAVSDPARYVVLLEQELHHARYQVLPDGAVRVLDPQLDIEAYSGLASAHGLGIVKLERRRMSLEQYYFDLKEKGAA